MPTCNWLDLESLGSWLIMPKTFSGTGMKCWVNIPIYCWSYHVHNQARHFFLENEIFPLFYHRNLLLLWPWGATCLLRIKSHHADRMTSHLQQTVVWKWHKDGCMRHEVKHCLLSNLHPLHQVIIHMRNFPIDLYPSGYLQSLPLSILHCHIWQLRH